MSAIRTEGRLVEALLLFLKQLTAHARWVFAALLVLYGVSGIHTIQPQETALVRRLGRLQNRVYGPGLLVGLPRPFDEVLRFETAKDTGLSLDRWVIIGGKIGDPDKPLKLSNEELERHLTTREVEGAQYAQYENKTLDPVLHGYTLTTDTNVIQGRFHLRYRIADPLKYTAAGQDIPALLERLAYQALSKEMGKRKIDASLTDERREVAAAAAQAVQGQAEKLQLGVKVSSLDIRELTPPAQVIASFEDVANARQFAKTMYENSRQYDAETLARSEGEAGAILHRAESYATGLVEAARGESSAFTSLLENYQRQPELVSSRLLRETLDTVMTQVNSTTLLPLRQARPTVILEPSPEFLR